MTTQRAGSSVSIVMRKIIPRFSKPNSALPPTFSSIRVSAVHQLRIPAWVATAA
jgi:hypothetical protein